MNSRGLQPGLMAGAIGLLIATGSGCGKNSAVLNPIQNLRPVIELTRAPFNESTRFEYSYRMNWLGYDPDGRVDYYLYTIDPPISTAANPEPESTWVMTNKSERLLSFSATRPDTIRANENGSSDFHTFVLKAIDNGGLGGRLQSAPLVRSFFTYTIAPTVQINSPSPSSRGRSYVPPSVRITWTGSDEDGIFNNQRPNKYKFIMLTGNTPVSFQAALNDGDAVRRYYAPLNWAGWDSTSADTTTRQFTNLTPGSDYMFVVVAFDEAGAYSPIFSRNSNMLNMRATFAAQGGPKMTVFSDIFFYQYDPAVYSILPQYQIKIEVPAGEMLTFNWSGEAQEGASVRGYRWALDIEDLSDQTPRTNERTDVTHWSQSSALSTSATVGPFGGGENHFFFIEAEDNNGLKSLATVNFTVVQSSLADPLLIVNDTRLGLDEWTASAPTCMTRPRGRWPMSAELDTFLYARGGKPWRCYPAGINSPTGIFSGYPFDTTDTRTGQSEVRLPLAKIGQYSHVIWMTDGDGALGNGPGTDLTNSVSALRYMSTPGRANSLAAYIRQGGVVWMLGGGGAFATLMPYNRTNNDTETPAAGIMFSFSNGELIPGRFMYDVFHWQSAIKAAASPITVTRFRARHDSAAVVPLEYRRLPAQMRPKSTGLGDTFPPYRTVSLGDFYRTSFDVEYLSLENYIIEDVDPSLLGVDERSTLDTLYQAVGNALMPPSRNDYNVCMTRYIGPASTSVIFTGFNIWSWTRADCKALVDAVLQDVWGFSPPVLASAHAPLISTASTSTFGRAGRLAPVGSPVRPVRGAAGSRER